MMPRPAGVQHGDGRSLAGHDVGLVLGHTGVVARDGDVGGDGHVGVEAVGAGAGALEAHFFLHGAHGLDGGPDLCPFSRRSAATIITTPARLSRALPVTKSLPIGGACGRW